MDMDMDMGMDMGMDIGMAWAWTWAWTCVHAGTGGHGEDKVSQLPHR